MKDIILFYFNYIMFTLLCIQGATGQVHFVNEPQNQCAVEGENVYFPCTYTGTTLLPKWRINDNEYTISTLPLFHHFDGAGILVTSVSSTMNLSRYTCFFNNQIMSNTAILTIVESKLMCFPALVTSLPLLSLDSLHWMATIATVTSMVPFHVLSRASHILVSGPLSSSQYHSNAVSSRSHVDTRIFVNGGNTGMNNIDPKYYIIIFGVIGMVVLTLATIALLVVVIRKVHWKKMESSGSNTDNQMKPSEPQYEEIGEPRAQQIQYEEIGEPLAQQTQHFMTHMSNDKELENMFTQRNVCYTSVILSRCPAYSTV